jgi:hypothetical protein
MRECRCVRVCIAFITMRCAGVGSCAGCTIEVCGKFHRRPSSGSKNVHTQPFAFRVPQEDDESVKISNTTTGRSSVLCASDDATNIVILSALSDFCEGRPAPLLPAGRSLPAAGRALSPVFLCAARRQKHQFLFDTNEPLSLNPNFATHTKQSTSFFLIDTNERSLITTHQSLITNFLTR